MKNICVAPSILSADFSILGEEIKAVQEAGADIIHLDVMDGHFVPNITFGPALVKSIRKDATAPLDCHLMISEPEKYVEAFAEAGADMISVHAEIEGLEGTVRKIRSMKCKAGAAINPPFKVEDLFPYLDYLNFVLIMTVHAGFSGQAMIEDCLGKIGVVKKEIERRGLKTLIEVDGGVTQENVKKVIDAGADIIVAGSAIYGKRGYKKAIADLRG